MPSHPPQAPPAPSRASPERWLADHGDILWRYAMARVDDPDAAEELVQETLLSAWGARDSYRGESSERTWLVAILRHKLADWARKSGRAARGESPLPVAYNAEGLWRTPPAPWPLDPDSVTQRPDFWRVFEACLARLPKPLAETFVMREIRGVSTEGVCEALKISSENVWVRLHRARQSLRDCLAAKWSEVQEREK